MSNKADLENKNPSQMNSDINLLAEETAKLLELARKGDKTKTKVPFTAGSKGGLKERGMSATSRLQSTKSAASLTTNTARSEIKIYQDDMETPVVQHKKLKKKKREKSMSLSMEGPLANTLDLFNQSQSRITVEIIDDASPDHTPRREYTPVKKGAPAEVSKGAEIFESETGARNLFFGEEKSRLLTKDDTFVPGPGGTADDVSLERQRLQKLEDSARRMRQTAEQERQNRINYLEQDKKAVKIQSMFRGHLGRMKFALDKKLKNMFDNDFANDWIEVRDRETGETWFYNQKTGESQWERPDNLFHFIAPSKNLNIAETTDDNPVYDSRYFPKTTKTLFQRPKEMQTTLPSNESTFEAKSTKNLMEGSFDASIKKALDKELGIDSSFARDKLTSIDGTFKPQLRTTIMEALNETRFDSVSSVLADDRWMEAEKDSFAKTKQNKVATNERLDPGKQPIVSVMNLSLEKKSKGTRLKIDSKSDKIEVEDLTLKNVEHFGMNSTVLPETDESMEIYKPQESNAIGRPEHMCFGCWSAGSKRTCELHEGTDKVKPSQTMLLCRNWELAVMKRRYRSEEIQEIFMKKTASIRFDVKRKKFLSVDQQKHLVYKLLSQKLDKENLKLGLIFRTKRWILSLTDEVRTGHVKSKKASVIERTAIMRLRRSIVNHAQVSKYGKLIEDKHPIPPTTGYSWPERLGEEKYLFQVPDPATGTEVEMILVYPIPVPKKLYVPRVYHLPAAKTIPMPKPDYRNVNPTLPANIFIDDSNPCAWFERIVAVNVRDALFSAIEQVKAVSPVPGLELLRREKQPPPSTVKFATLGKKPTPEMLDLGGLPAELLIYQLISTYYPPQYGSLMVMDKSIVSPGFSPETMITFESVLTPPVKADCIVRPVEHPLNYRRVPTIAIHSKIDEQEGKHFYGANRPEQTGEQFSYGFRTTTHGKNVMVYLETDPQVFTPGTEIASLNNPCANKSNTTHADFSYPFCEPSTRDNTSLDFYHLLLDGVCSISVSQIFTALSIQEPGFFLKEMNPELPMGHLVVSIYRSWSFVQSDMIEEFKTDDGISYWYHRKTGQTFWERPLYEAEEKSPLLGGTFLDMDHPEEPLTFHVGENGLQRRYTQGEFRKNQLIHHESDGEAKLRRETTANSAKLNKERGFFDPKPVEAKKEEEKLDFKEPEDDKSVASSRLGTLASNPSNADNVQPFGWSKNDPNANAMAQSANNINNPQKPKDIFDPKYEEMMKQAGAQAMPAVAHPNTNGGNPALPSGLDSNLMVELSQKVSQMMSSIMDAGGPNEMIQMGLGMGMALMQAASTGVMGITDNIVNPPEAPTVKTSNHNDQIVTEQGMIPNVSESFANGLSKPLTNGEPIGHATAIVKFASENKLDHNEESKQKSDLAQNQDQKLSAEEIARRIAIKVDPTPTPDVAPPKYLTNVLPKNCDEGNKESIPIYVYPELSTLLPAGVPPSGTTNHPVAGLGTSFVLEKDYDLQAKVQNTKHDLRRVVMPLPAGFFNAITKKHVASAEVDYLPQVPNLPQAKTVGRVKPRSTNLDWLAVAFDPWSAGINPLSVEYINSLSSKADKLFQGMGPGKALEQIDQLRNATVSDAFATIEDLEGMAQKREEVSKQQLLAQDFKRACTLIRHNKYQEAEDMLNQAEWNVPIDYQDELGNALIHVACQNGNKRLVKMCLRRGAQLDLQNLQGQTPLHYAFGYGYTDVGEYLLKKGADDSVRNKDGLTCYEGLGARELALL